MSLNQPFNLDKVYGFDKSFVDTLSLGLFYTDIKGQCLYVNSKWLDIADVSLEEALDDGWAEAIHADDRIRVVSEWNESVKSDRQFISEYRFQKHDETIIWVIAQANKSKDIDGNFIGYVGTVTDITERKNTETSLQQLVKGFSVVSSSEFFRSFSIHLGEVLDVDYVVSEIIDESSDSVKSVVVNHRGEILDPIQYLLQGTPCETVMGKSVKGYGYGIQKIFPDFELLKALDAEGYVGTLLFDSVDKPIGIIAILDSRPIENIKMVENVLQIYAMRASTELERKQKEEVLQALNKELEFKQFTVEHMSESIFWADVNAKFYDVNGAACQSLGYTREELLQLSIPDIDPDISFEVWEEHRLEIKEGKNNFESRHMTKDGRIFPVEVNVNHIEFNGENYYCSAVRNISERIENERDRENNLSLQNAILEATADGILVVNTEGEITNYNQQFVKVWGVSHVILNEKNHEKVLTSSLNKVKNPEEFLNRVNEIYSDTNSNSFDTVELVDGRILERYSRPQKIGNKVVGRVWSFRDVTEKHNLTEQLSYQANHDPLTGLVNRREFEKRLVRLLSSVDAKSEHVMCYMDLDNFKQVNDVYGHIAGDYLLKKISDLFQDQVRGRDTLARLGGDEFGLIMEHCSVEQADKVANNFIRLINECKLIWEGKECNIGVSVGVVKINDPRVGILEIMKNADAACYTAKKSGRNCVHVSLD